MKRQMTAELLPDHLSLSRVLDMLAALGAGRVWMKPLSPNDNSKNQLYLGGDFGVLNVLPSRRPVATETEGKMRKPIFKAGLDLRWLGSDGTVRTAPDAKLILYPQYPEVRLSGYLLGVPTSHRPSEALGTTRETERVLLLGCCGDGRIIGVAARRGSPLARECLSFENLEESGILRRIPMPSHGDARDSRHALLEALCRIARKGWIDSRRLDSTGATVPCNARNCGGYTLEAELGVRPNSFAQPDFMGWEVKQFGVTDLARPSAAVITLMTPEPTEGIYATQGVIKFVEQFGYPDVAGQQGRWNFGGIFRSGATAPRTGLTLRVDGFDHASGRLRRPDGGLFLLDAKDRVAAGWRFVDLLDHWKAKHAQAVYIPSVKREAPRRQYRFGANVLLGAGTTFERFLSAIHRGEVYLDPGIKVEGYPQKPVAKKRNQFRVKLSSLASLYASFRTEDACSPALMRTTND